MNYIKCIDVIETKVCLCAPRIVAWFYFVFIYSACCLLRQSCVGPSQAAAFDWFATAPIGIVYIAHLTTISSLCFWLHAKQFFFLSSILFLFILFNSILSLQTILCCKKNMRETRKQVMMKYRTFMKCMNKQVKITFKSIYTYKIN